MTREEAIDRLRHAQQDGPEEGHMAADRVLCEFLKSLGFADVVAEWEKIRKWYA